MPFWLATVFGWLIVARATRFVNSDVLAEGIRNWADGIESAGRFRPLRRALRRPLVKIFGRKTGDLFTCPWCLSIYFSLPVAIIVATGFGHFSTGGTWLAVVGLWFGYSYSYALVANNLDD
jgi:hypothetical protein